MNALPQGHSARVVWSALHTGPFNSELITSRLREFFDLFPRVDEIVLTMTETRFPVFRRTFCSIPVSARVRRVLRALEPMEKQLVVRPFSALREDEVHVREAVERLQTRSISMMYKTGPTMAKATPIVGITTPACSCGQNRLCAVPILLAVLQTFAHRLG